MSASGSTSGVSLGAGLPVNLTNGRLGQGKKNIWGNLLETIISEVLFGPTSWYHHVEKITQNSIKENLFTFLVHILTPIDKWYFKIL